MDEVINNDNGLVHVALQIILHAGDARNKITEALSYAKKWDFENASKNINIAEEAIILAHKAQTDIIQGEASGHKYEFSLLFAHAQDTLMTINSEFRMAKEMIEILKLISETIK